MIPLHHPGATTQSCMTLNMQGQILSPELNINFHHNWNKHKQDGIPKHHVSTFCCCTVCSRRSLVIGNKVFLCTFLRVLQCCKLQKNEKQILRTCYYSQIWTEWRPADGFRGHFTYLFSTLAIPKSPSCTVPSFVKNMFYGDIMKRHVNNTIFSVPERRSCRGWRAIPAIWCPCGGFFDHARASVPSKSARTNPRSKKGRVHLSTSYSINFVSTSSAIIQPRDNKLKRRQRCEIEPVNMISFICVFYRLCPQRAWLSQRGGSLLALLRTAFFFESWSSWRGLLPHSSPSQCTDSPPLKRIS